MAVEESSRRHLGHPVEAVSDHLAELCELLRSVGATLTFYGKPVTEAELREQVTERVEGRIVGLLLGAIDIGHGVQIAPMEDGTGIYWKHPGCRPWFHLRFKPDPRSTGHELVEGSLSNLSAMTIRGSLGCPKGCPAHGEIRKGRWEPC